MTPFRVKPGHTFKLRVYGSDGRSEVRSCGTRNPHEARAIQRAHDAVREIERYAPLLDAVLDRRLTIGQVRAAYEAHTLDALLAQLDDIDLSPLVDDWRRAMERGFSARGKGIGPDTRAHYVHGVRTLIKADEPFPRSALTSERLQTWVNSRDDVLPPAVRKHGMGMRVYCLWLRKTGRLTVDPMADVVLPPSGEPRIHYLETDEAIRLAEACDPPLRELEALLAGTGLDLSTALRLTRRDVDTTTQEIKAFGTKTRNRRRIVRVAEWAWGYVERLIDGKLPDAALFPGLSRWTASDQHRAVAAKMAEKDRCYAGYMLRDHRHTWAVRSARSGWPVELIARQLGHTDGTMVLKVYGRFFPSGDEREHWEQVATARDAARKVAK